MRGSSALSRVIDLISVGIVLAGGAVFARALLPQAEVTQPQELRVAAELMDPRTEGRWIGPEAASIVFVVYMDYQCGFCLEFQRTLDRLRSRYPQHVAVVLKHFVNPTDWGRYRIPAGLECADDQGHLEKYQTAILQSPELLGYSQGWIRIAEFAQVPELDEFARCVRSGRYKRKIDLQHNEGKRLGVESIPTLFLKGEVIPGAVRLSRLDSIVASYLRK